MKKRALLVLLTLIFVSTFGLSGCFALPNIGGIGSKPMMDAKIANTFTIGNYDGSTLLVVELDVTNNSDSNLPASIVQMYAVGTLDGKTLSEAYLSSDNPYAIDFSVNIAPGSTGTAQLVFDLPSTEGTVDIVMNVDNTDYSDTVEVLNESIDLADVEAIVSESDFDIEVTDVIITDDGEGKDLAVLFVTFTNNSDEATSFGSAIDLELFQNDIALKSGYLPYNHPASDSDLQSNSYTDIKKGASLELMTVFELNDAKSPIEIKCIDRTSFDQVVILDKTIEVSGASGSSGSGSSGSDSDDSDSSKA